MTASPSVMGEDAASTAGAKPANELRRELVTGLYRDGVPVLEIARRADVCVKTVRNIARRAGLPPRHPPQPERDAAILTRYVAGDPVASIAADYDVAQSRVRAIAARAGVPARTGWQRRYPLNERAFDEPTAVGWWLIGLLAADGSIHEREHRITLCQTLDGVDALYAFYEYVGCPERPLILRPSATAEHRQMPGRPAAEARIFSKRIVDALGHHGVVAAKTATLVLGSEAAREPAVWLGLLDGDGSVGIYRDGREPRVRFSGTKRLMEQCEVFWRETLPYGDPRPTATPHCKGLWQFSLCRAKARGAARILLASCGTSLSRKRALLAEIANW